MGASRSVYGSQPESVESCKIRKLIGLKDKGSAISDPSLSSIDVTCSLHYVGASRFSEWFDQSLLGLVVRSVNFARGS